MDQDQLMIGREIGSGSFGQVHLGLNNRTGGKIAIKRELVETKHPQLVNESEIYKHLKGGTGIPSLHWFGELSRHRVMVTDLLGPSLEDLFDVCGRRFSLKTVLMLADQLIDILEYIHTQGVLHRDIKPENLLMGCGGKSHQVHLTDFGLAGFYQDRETGKHLLMRSDGGFMGTLSYASIYAHMGSEQGRRNDLESLGYVLVYFLSGSLPWQGCPNPREEMNQEQENDIIWSMKINTMVEDLCESCPPESRDYFFYCRLLLGSRDKPDYSYLKQLFHKAFTRQGFKFDYVYDWEGMIISLPGGRLWPTQVTVEEDADQWTKDVDRSKNVLTFGSCQVEVSSRKISPSGPHHDLLSKDVDCSKTFGSFQVGEII